MQFGADSLSANIDTAAVTRAACEGQISALVLRPFPLEPTRRVIQETGNMMVCLKISYPIFDGLSSLTPIAIACTCHIGRFPRFQTHPRTILSVVHPILSPY